MPILIKDYTWSQTDDLVRVSVPLKSANSRTTLDLFTQPTFIKVNAAPYFLELFLAHTIDAAASTTKVYENEIKFRLVKREPGTDWLSLEKCVERSETVANKNCILETAHELAEQESKDRAKRAYDIKQNEIQKEIERETKIREQVTSLEKDAVGIEMQAVDVLKTEANKSKTRFNSEQLENLKRLNRGAPSLDLVQNNVSNKKNIPLIQTTIKTKDLNPKIVSTKSQKLSTAMVPQVRRRGEISVEFSERKFPTPMRESQEPMEQEWILKQNEARKAIGFVEEDLRPEERNLDWLKEKGNDFFAKQNYLGAVSAYTTAIRMNPKCFELYLNRSTCHYALGNFNRCVEDTSKAYELLVPAVPSNLKFRSQCLAKRGAALCKLGYLRQGRDEMEAALKLVPDNETLRTDLATIEEALCAAED